MAAGRWAVVLTIVGLSSLRASAQAASAQLSVNLTVQSSISLVFQNSPTVGTAGFCPLTNSGTNNVGLDLGIASFSGGATTCGAYSRIGAATYQISTAFDVVVNKANTSSPTYRLAASLSSAPPANVTWILNNNTTLSTTMTALTNNQANAYGTRATQTLSVQVKNSVPAQILQETITFLATAN